MSASVEPKKTKVLILEDSPTQTLLLKESLEENHFEVMAAKDGLEGLVILQTNLPEVIISDIDMPRMNGYDFCLRVKQDPKLKEIPVILLTNLTDSMDAIKGIECGADSFITKPCEIGFLLSTMNDVLNNSNRQKELKSEKQIEFFFAGQKHTLNVNDMQVTDLLLSTFTAAIQKNMELEKAYRKLNLIHEDLERKTAQLEELNNQKNQFLGMAAHDLRNPLALIQGYSQLLLEKFHNTEDEKTVQMLETIKRSSSTMFALINDLLDVSVIESGVVNLHLDHYHLNNIVDEILPLVSKLASDKNISLTVKCIPETIDIYCDRIKMEQILSNLITNAIKFSNPGTNIEISLGKTDTEILIAVKDQGVGIPSGEIEKIFTPFAKSSNKTTAGEPSTGLGLAIVNKVVQAHKGKIWVESEMGKGSTFYVSFPLMQNTELGDNTQWYVMKGL